MTDHLIPGEESTIVPVLPRGNNYFGYTAWKPYPGTVTAPDNSDLADACPVRIFMGGSIEMGAAADWQKEFSTFVEQKAMYVDYMKIAMYNPRRTDWDSSWAQDPNYGSQFNEQVAWELKHLRKANVLVFNFEPGTVSPITLLEFGLYAKSHVTKFVVCPQDYARHGNVKITAALEGVNVKFYEKRDETFYKDLFLEIQKILIEEK